MPTVREIETCLFDWAPRELAMSWDNVGLLAGEADAPVKRVLVALDITEGVAEEAVERKADLIVAHHPLLNHKWHPLQSVSTDNAQGRLLIRLLRSGISAICMHTNLDAAEGGVNDLLATALGLTQLQPLNEEKIGRIGLLNPQIHLEQFLPLVVQSLGCTGLRYRDGGKPVHRVAVGGGACSDYIGQALALGCDTFVTADVRYHEFLDATELNLIDAGHYPTEDVICGEIIRRLGAAFPTIELVKSTFHREVIEYFCKGE